jgi:hypothetical protein
MWYYSIVFLIWASMFSLFIYLPYTVMVGWNNQVSEEIGKMKKK